MRVVRATMLLGMAACLSLGLIGVARAQDDAFGNIRLRARFGFYFPTETQVRELNTIWLGAGLDFVGKGLFGPNSNTIFTADIYNRSGGGTSGTITPLLLGQMWNMNPDADEGPRWYAGIALGMVVGDIGGPSKNKFGGKLFGGLDVTSNVFFELSFLFTDKFDILGGTDTARGNGATVMVGYRF